jgi:hypothetical protein
MSQADRRGDGVAARHAAKLILHGLQTQPREFGEPRKLYRHLNIVSRIAVVRPLAVFFGVHQTLPLVFVRGFHLISTGEVRDL